MNKLMLFSLNVNCDRRNDNPNGPFAAAFADLSFQSRFSVTMALIKSAYKKCSETVFLFQEASDEACDILKTSLKEMGLDVLTNKYAPDRGAFNFVFAFNPELYKLEEIKQIYYTESGLPTSPEEREQLTKDEKIQRHCGTEFEKSAQLVRLFHKEANKSLLLVNTHPGLENEHRLQAMSKLCEALEQEKGIVILAGDFNQFDKRVPEAKLFDEQIDILEENGFHWESKNLSNQGLKSTFISFPFDIFRFFNREDFAELDQVKEQNDPVALREFCINKIQEKNISLFGACLDAIFTRGINQPVTTKAYMMFCGEKINTLKITNRNELQREFLDYLKGNSAEPALNSDHAVLVSEIPLLPASKPR